MVFGDMNDPDSEISRVMATNALQVIKPEKDTEPQVHYISADEAVMRTTGTGEKEGGH
jgi:tetrathionate reductase subunit B